MLVLKYTDHCNCIALCQCIYIFEFMFVYCKNRDGCIKCMLVKKGKECENDIFCSLNYV